MHSLYDSIGLAQIVCGDAVVSKGNEFFHIFLELAHKFFEKFRSGD